MPNEPAKLHGLMAVFDEPEHLLEAVQKVRLEGYRDFDAFSPFPLEGLTEAMEIKHTWIAPICWMGGFLGATSAFALQWYNTGISFPLNVGGRPYFSWPAYVPITFEIMVLTAGCFVFFGILGLNRLPKLYHPVFNIEEFRRRNSTDGFFLLIEAADRRFEKTRTQEFLLSLSPVRTYEVPDEP